MLWPKVIKSRSLSHFTVPTEPAESVPGYHRCISSNIHPKVSNSGGNRIHNYPKNHSGRRSTTSNKYSSLLLLWPLDSKVEHGGNFSSISAILNSHLKFSLRNSPKVTRQSGRWICFSHTSFSSTILPCCSWNVISIIAMFMKDGNYSQVIEVRCLGPPFLLLLMRDLVTLLHSERVPSRCSGHCSNPSFKSVRAFLADICTLAAQNFQCF